MGLVWGLCCRTLGASETRKHQREKGCLRSQPEALKLRDGEEESRWRRNRTDDHFLFYKFIERITEWWTKFTGQLLIASSGHQAPRKAAHCLRREVGQGYWRSKRETRERGTETRPGKGVLIEEVSNHQETLALAVRGKLSNLGGQPNWEEKLNKAHRLRA